MIYVLAVAGLVAAIGIIALACGVALFTASLPRSAPPPVPLPYLPARRLDGRQIIEGRARRE